jgi:hypothetical protein
VPYTLVVIKHEAEHRAHEKEHGKHRGPQYPFMRVRRKAFPWEASDCDYLDLDCHAEFQKAKAARKAGIECVVECAPRPTRRLAPHTSVFTPPPPPPALLHTLSPCL